jgi:uncharacterized protein YndB with AHSA1/START domain
MDTTRNRTWDLTVEREVAASPEDCFDAFVALYERDRPDWVTESDLDLRVGGRWHVRFHPAPNPPFREERTITDVHRGKELGYHARIQDDEGHERFATQVLVTFEPTAAGTGIRLTQTGFEDEGARDEFEANWPSVLSEVARRLGD